MDGWESGGRTGRWGPRVALGAKISAHPHPASIKPYGRPPAVGVQFYREPALGGGHAMRPHDPCDDEYDQRQQTGLVDRVKAKVGVAASVPAPTDLDDWSVGG